MKSEQQQRIETSAQDRQRHTGPRVVRGGAGNASTGVSSAEQPVTMRGGGGNNNKLSGLASPTVAAPNTAVSKSASTVSNNSTGSTSGQSSGLLSRLLGGQKS